MGNIYAKTHEHVKSDMSKTHGLATLRPYQYYVVKPLKNKEKLYYLKIFIIPFFAKKTKKRDFLVSNYVIGNRL